MHHRSFAPLALTLACGLLAPLAPAQQGVPVEGEANWIAAWRAQRNAIADADKSLDHDPSSILVQFCNTAKASDVELIKSLAGLKVIETFGTGTQHLMLPPGATVEETLRLVGALGQAFNGAVDFAEPDQIARIVATPNDPSLPMLWGMNNTGQAIGGVAGTPNADIDATQAWDIFTGDRNFVIGVCDTGIRRSHQDLASNLWINAGEIPDGVDNDGNGKVDDLWGWDFWNNDKDPMDDNNHGSHVSGTIGGRGNNARGVAGVNWVCSLAGLKIGSAGGSISVSAAIASLDYCIAKNIRVSNHSWGGGGYSTAMFNAINRARTAGHLFVAAAGNDNNNNDVNPFYPASYTLDNIISVAAIDNRNNKASFSNYGATSVDIAAPGVNILSCTKGSDTSYAYFNGTSMASPHVAGVAALLWARNPTWTYAQVRGRILSTAKPVPAMVGRCATGGCVSAFEAIRPAFAGLEYHNIKGHLAP